MNRPEKIVILGAGVCGLYAALTALRKGVRVTLIEKCDQPGGLASGFKRGANYYDQGVHMLHAADQEIYEDIAELMAGERVPVTLDARIRWNNRSYRYPLKGFDILAGMPPLALIRCCVGLALAELLNRLSQTQANAVTAEDALIATYGAPLYEFFFEEFTHNYWSVHPRDLSAEFVRRKMPRLNILDLIEKCLPAFLQRKSKDLVVESVVADETLHYSATGSETLPRVLAGEIEKMGGEILYEAEIKEITVSEVKLANQVVPYSALLSTIPISSLIDLTSDAPDAVRASAECLRYKPIVTYGLLVRKEKCLQGLYTYYRDRVFHRVGEPKSAGLRVTPADHSVLIVEITCDQNDAIWNDEAVVRDRVKADLVAEKICEPDEIVEWNHFTNAHGYPIYRVDFEEHLEIVRQWLNSKEFVTSTGRQGAFAFPGDASSNENGAGGDRANSYQMMSRQISMIEGGRVSTRVKIHDDRGWFLPAVTGDDPGKEWILQNVSSSKPGTLRGLHYQDPVPQSKLLVVLEGEIQDIVADLRPESPTYLKFMVHQLEAGFRNQVFVPRGCAHGFLVTGEEPALISYLADAPYFPEYEKTLWWDCPDWNFPWETSSPILSSKDRRVVDSSEAIE